ncbi:MAG: cytochrome c-type biogenesis CcmF C-terminal domain-containing protein, partial [Cobetia crustatorum]
VLLGTLYPLVLDSLNLGKISVGPPYFNALFVPLTTLLCAFMGLGPSSRWKQMQGGEIFRRLALSGVAALVIGGLLPLTLDIAWSASVALGLVIALWVVLPLLRDLWDKSASKAGRLAGLKRLTPSYWGMQLAHLGIAVTIVGVTLVSNTEVAENVRMTQGKVVTVGGYEFNMTQLGEYRGPNYLANRATVEVSREGKPVTVLHPEKRLFLASGMPMTETALDAGFTRDLYVAMGEKLDDGSWAVRIQVKPFVRWLWLGALLMGAGGVIAVLDRRYRRRVDPRPTSLTTEREVSV